MTAVLLLQPYADGEAVLHFPGTVLDLPDATAAALRASAVATDPAVGAVDWWGAPRRILAAEPAEHVVPFATGPTAGARTIVQGCGYDPGNAVYRFHTALNETTAHASLLFRWRDTSRFASLRQYDGEHDAALLRDAVRTADVVHCHMNYLVLTNSRVKARGLVIRHYHGSRPDGTSLVEQRLDDAMGAVQLGARLALLRESPRVRWMPIPVPCDRYRAMRANLSGIMRPVGERPFRVAHSPSRRDYKGTDSFLAAVQTLRTAGHHIEAVLIEGVSHDAALWLKASCDAVFDSFWLGLQGSGLEGAAMGLPVVAGDADAAALYREQVGEVPYTFADDGRTLTARLLDFLRDPEYARAEAARAESYTRRVHDYAAVGARYSALLREVLA